MANYKVTKILPIALVLIIVAVAIAALVSIARVIFYPNSSNSTSSVDVGKAALLDTSAGHAVRLTVRGKLVADENFNSYQIQITPSERKLTIYKGYLDNSINNISLGNNLPSYEQFVYALDKAKLDDGTELTGDSNNQRGICATGYVYNFEIMKDNKSVKQLWTSSCSGSKGSLSASVDQLIGLFMSQIPNAETMTSNI
jgi:hypothetical protein